MNRRDMGWRLTGAVAMSTACIVAVAIDGIVLPLVLLPVALLAIPFIVHGKHVVQSLRAERRRRWHTLLAIHRARQGRS